MSESEVKIFDIKSTKINNYTGDQLFIDKNNTYIYSFLVDKISIYSNQFKFIENVNVFEEKEISINYFICVKQNKDDTFLILTNKELIHYTPPKTFKVMKEIRNASDVLISPDGKWIFIHGIVKKITYEPQHYSHISTTEHKLFKFYNYEFVKSDERDLPKFPIINIRFKSIDNEGCLSALYFNKYVKYDNQWKEKSVTKYPIDHNYIQHISKDGKIIVNVLYNNLIVIIKEDVNGNLHEEQFVKNICYIDMLYNHIYFINIQSVISIYNVKTNKTIQKIKFKSSELIYTDIKHIRKLGNLLVICNNNYEVMIYDLIEERFTKIFKNDHFNSLSIAKVKMPTHKDPSIILYYTDNIVIFNPLLNKEVEKTFLFGELVHPNGVCTVNKFIKDWLFDRHLLPIIFGYLPEY